MQTLFFNGKFYLGSGRWAAAVLAGVDGAIVDVSGNVLDPVLFANHGIRHHDFGGCFVFPAFEDAHNHPAARARTRYELDFRAKDTAWDDVRNIMLGKAAVTPADQWIVCHGWSDARWPGVAAMELNSMFPDHGIMLVHISYHGGIINKKGAALLAERGLALSDIIMQHGGRITEQDFEEALIMTSGSREQYREAIPLALNALVRKGIAAVHDMHVSTMEQLEAYAELARTKSLPIAAALYLNPRLLNESAQLRPHLQKNYNGLTIAGVKLFLDGAIGTSTAAVSRPYRDGTGSGVLRMSYGECAAVIKKAGELGLGHVAMHCIGDRALDVAVDIFERLRDEYRRDITTWRFEHFEMPSERAIRALADRGGIASMQPNFNWDVAHYRARLGDDAERLNPFRAIQDAGATLAFGSDDMPSDPVAGIRWATINAPSLSQKLTLDEALDAYTSSPAKILGADRIRGKIAKGYEANFVAFERNPFDASSDASACVPKEVWYRGMKI